VRGQALPVSAALTAAFYFVQERENSGPVLVAVPGVGDRIGALAHDWCSQGESGLLRVTGSWHWLHSAASSQ